MIRAAVAPVVPGYDELVEIGRGGFAVVFRARDRRFNRTVAVKVLVGVPDGPARARFERECRAMGVVSRHPHCVTVYDSGFTPDGRAYLVMEDMTGGPLAARLPVPWADALDVGVKLAGALQAAHDAGVLHRDVKPDNVLLSAYGEPKLGDFGIARLEDGLRTRTGMVSGTPAHAAPEIFDGEPATATSDVYSLASTLFALITGGAAFVHDTDESYLPVIARVGRDPVPDLRPRGVPEPVCRALESGMEKDPARRAATAAEYGHRLQEAQRETGREPTRMVTAAAPEPPADPGRTIAQAAPATPHSGFWFAVDEPAWLVSPYDDSQMLGVLEPGRWYLAGEQHGAWVYAADERGVEGWVALAAIRRYEPDG